MSVFTARAYLILFVVLLGKVDAVSLIHRWLLICFGTDRVSNRLAALQSIEKLSGMHFGPLAGGLRVRLAEEVRSRCRNLLYCVDLFPQIPGDSSDSEGGAAPTLPSYRTLPDIQDYRSTLAPPNNMEGPLSSSTSAPAVASMIGSGLNRLLFTSDSCDSLSLNAQKPYHQNRLSPSTGRLLASPARLSVPFTPAMSSSVSMPHVAPR
jgi:hypothetical protein